MDVSVGFRGLCRGCFRGDCRGIAVEIAMASAMGLHGVPRHSVEAHGIPVEARGRSAVARGVSVVVRGTPWK